MAARHLDRNSLAGRIIDAHSHLGVSLGSYARLEYPCAETLEGLYYRQKAGGVDCNVVFPYTADLFFDPAALLAGRNVPARAPLSHGPYAVENERVLREVFEFCPEIAGRFLPFVSADPGREVEAQVRKLIALDAVYPIYGIKIAPVACQSRITELLDRGKAILELAREKGWPLLLHTTSDEEEEFSRASLAFQVIERNPGLRFCLAHCIGFDRHWLKRAHEMPNVWVDTSALKIQVQLAFEDHPVMAPAGRRFEADYSDHRKVLRSLMEQFPETILWGTDTPAYSFICRRMQAEGVFVEFRLKANYEDELAALNALPPAARWRAANANTLDFLFGPLPEG